MRAWLLCEDFLREGLISSQICERSARMLFVSSMEPAKMRGASHDRPISCKNVKGLYARTLSLPSLTLKTSARFGLSGLNESGKHGNI